MLRARRDKCPSRGGDGGPAGGRQEGLSGGAAQEAQAEGQGAEHKLSYSRLDFFSLLAATVREFNYLYGMLMGTKKNPAFFAPRGSGYFRS